MVFRCLFTCTVVFALYVGFYFCVVLSMLIAIDPMSRRVVNETEGTNWTTSSDHSSFVRMVGGD